MPDTRIIKGRNDMSTLVPQLPDGCGYEGSDFGASYPDSKCFGGRLYDLDNCDDEGNLYELKLKATKPQRWGSR